MKLGCNYRASHAGLNMWRNRDPKAINDDLDLLSEREIKGLLVFPIWPEFLKQEPVYGGNGQLLEISGGVSKKEIDKLIFLICAARERNIEVFVSLNNGWMSGRLFASEPFYNINVLTDPEAIGYQIIYIRELVESLKHHVKVIVWDLGNEFYCDTKLVITGESCIVLLKDANGNPFLTKNKLRAGTMHFCRAPVEMNYIDSVEYIPEVYFEICKYILFCGEVDS